MDLNRVDLNLLVAFDALISEGSVTRAAERLHIGQSAMSSTLARLRKLLDDPVLIREGRQMVPTPLALSLIAPVREVLDRVETILSAGDEFDAAQAQRTFTMVGSDYTSLTFVNPLIDRLSVESPGIKIRLIPPGDDYTDRLRRGQADLVIMPRAVFTEHRASRTFSSSRTDSSARSMSITTRSQRRSPSTSSHHSRTWRPHVVTRSPQEKHSSTDLGSRETSRSQRQSGSLRSWSVALT